MDSLTALAKDSAGPFSMAELGLHLALAIVLSQLLRWHFTRFARVMADRHEVGLVFTFVTLTTLLVITVVKSSLALSLGLVGALSIVRFRTPIKEPEELAYLFLSIGIGLGLGANQIAVTTLCVGVTLLVVALYRLASPRERPKIVYLSLTHLDAQAEGFSVDHVNKLLLAHLDAVDLRRFNQERDQVDVTYFIRARTPEQLTALTTELSNAYPKLTVSFIDQPRLPGL